MRPIQRVLDEAWPGDLSIREIERRILEKGLKANPGASVGTILADRSREPLFERVGSGRYRLRDSLATPRSKT